MRMFTMSLLALFTAGFALPVPSATAGPRHPLTFRDFKELVDSGKKFKGEDQEGLSNKSLRERFEDLLDRKVTHFMANSIGGYIQDFGERRSALEAATCEQRPTLSMEDVAKLAQESFNLRSFQPLRPPCTNGGKVVSCNYDTGNCCQRPQVEFIGRYYDTAIAAMALGATSDEAFAPLIHARALAYTLVVCDPDVSKKGYFEQNNLEVAGVWKNGHPDTGTWKNSHMSLISFPQSYEVLYELYNAMLVERLRSRQKTHFPSHMQMEALRAQVYYKKLFVRVLPLDFELRSDLAFPSSSDFAEAGLTMVTPSRIMTSRLVSIDDSKAMVPRSFFMNSTLRTTLTPFSVYEVRSRSRRTVDLQKCNFAW